MNKSFSYQNHPYWKVVYAFYPPILRLLEHFQVHSEIQPFLLGHLKEERSLRSLKAHLLKEGFEDSILAWKDPGEVLSMRKLDGPLYQYHIRLFENSELRGHYEFASEGNPLGHIFSSCFEPRTEYFLVLLQGFLDPLKGKKRKKNSASKAGGKNGKRRGTGRSGRTH